MVVGVVMVMVMVMVVAMMTDTNSERNFKESINSDKMKLKRMQSMIK
jgi:hypothetical protein